MKLDLPDEYVPLIIRALEHYYAYTQAMQRQDSRFKEAADFLKRKGPGKETGEAEEKRKRG